MEERKKLDAKQLNLAKTIEKLTGTGPINQLPDELILQIAGFLNHPDDLIALSGVSKRMREICSDSRLWGQFGFKSKDEYIASKQIENIDMKIVLFGKDEAKRVFIRRLMQSEDDLLGSKKWEGFAIVEMDKHKHRIQDVM